MFHRLSVARLLCFPTLIFCGGSPQNLLVMCSSSSRGSGTGMVVNARNQSSPSRPSSHCHPKSGTSILSLRRRQIEPRRASAACRRAESRQNRSSSSHRGSSSTPQTLSSLDEAFHHSPLVQVASCCAQLHLRVSAPS
ncbi:hypothetical protein Bca4012_027390 [Brassica carinata]